jgi:hypothetical protein
MKIGNTEVHPFSIGSIRAEGREIVVYRHGERIPWIKCGLKDDVKDKLYDAAKTVQDEMDKIQYAPPVNGSGTNATIRRT